MSVLFIMQATETEGGSQAQHPISLAGHGTKSTQYEADSFCKSVVVLERAPIRREPRSWSFLFLLIKSSNRRWFDNALALNSSAVFSHRNVCCPEDSCAVGTSPCSADVCRHYLFRHLNVHGKLHDCDSPCTKDQCECHDSPINACGDVGDTGIAVCMKNRGA